MKTKNLETKNNKSNDETACCSSSPSSFVALGASLGGILLVVIALFLIFADNATLDVLIPIVWGYVVLGCALGFFNYLSIKNKK